MSGTTESQDALHTMLKFVFYLYMVSVVCAVPYYNWKYAQQKGFIKWLMFGETVPTGEALIWPYYAFGHASGTAANVKPLTQKQQDEMTEQSFIDALNASQQASFIIKTAAVGTPIDQIPHVDKAVAYRNQAVSLADGLDEGALNRLYPELGTHFKNQFRAAMNYFVLGVKNRSDEDIVKFGQLNDAWADWYNANRQAIDHAFDAALQCAHVIKECINSGSQERFPCL
jgi:hypothetical protein